MEIASTERGENRPERTTYRITDAGRTTLSQWLRDMLSAPALEYPEFPAALSFLPNLAPSDVIAALTLRVDRLEKRLSALDTEIAQVAAFLPRLFAIESEYQRQILAAEVAFVRNLIEELRAERITWPFVDGASTWQADAG